MNTDTDPFLETAKRVFAEVIENFGYLDGFEALPNGCVQGIAYTPAYTPVATYKTSATVEPPQVRIMGDRITGNAYIYVVAGFPNPGEGLNFNALAAALLAHLLDDISEQSALVQLRGKAPGLYDQFKPLVQKLQ